MCLFVFCKNDVLTVSSSHLKPFEVLISQWTCVQRETKARNPSLFALQAFSWNLTSLTICHNVIGLFTECKQTTNTKAKECGSVVSSCFFAGSIVWHPKNSCGGDNLYAATIYFPESGRLRGIELQLVFQKFWKVVKLLHWYVTWTKLEIQEWNDWKSHILFN